MYRKCVTEISVQHQKQVEQGLLELMEKMPYEDITVTALCQASGISRRVFYHLFSNKADALYAMIDHAILESGSYRPELHDDILRFFLYWQERRNLLDVLQSQQLTGILMERMLACILDEDYDIRHWLKTHGWENERDVILFYLSGIMGLVYRWYFNGFQESPEEMAILLKKIMAIPFTGEI